MSFHAADIIPNLLLAAFLLPLAGFVVELFLANYWQRDRKNKTPAYLAVGAIGGAFLLSLSAFLIWGAETEWATFTRSVDHQEASESEHASSDAEAAAEHPEKAHPELPVYSGLWYTLGKFGDLTIGIEYYIDSLTLAMFVMVTLIATCIHVFAMGYMSDELTNDYVDHEVHTSAGGHFHRPGRYYRFFAYMSLFSFSMLGIVISGSIFMVFIFWELVGVSSYLLIGFYIERKTASTAANKAFIMNRVGDFGFLVGMMVIWTYFGTFSFGGLPAGDGSGEKQPGLFAMVSDHNGKMQVEEAEDGRTVVQLQTAEHHPEGAEQAEAGSESRPAKSIPYWLLVVAGVGVFAGCIGKSAQFPLQTWLPDAMEGPTPVSALVHSATMVAAGVYLTARFAPMFTAEVLLVIAYVGCITLFLGATIAIVATDIKRVLAYSTISQLGYMMLALGLAGWGAGLFHLFTHAFFKSLMFLAAGSVIVGCHHVQEMPRMGGLWRKMPITAITMLIGVIAICGLAVPGTPFAFSGYHSKDAIIATALAYQKQNEIHFLLIFIPLITAGLTAFYMFRLWFYTFWGEPRDEHVHEHVKESPWVMTGPLLVLALFAAGCAMGGEEGPLYQTILASEPPAFANLQEEMGLAGTTLNLPGHAEVHEVHNEAGLYALIVAFAGAILAYLVYGARLVDAGEIKKQFAGVHGFLTEKWQFDELYDAAFVRPAHVVGRWMTVIDRKVLDGILHGLAAFSVKVSTWDRWFDEKAVDGLVQFMGDKTYAAGAGLRGVQRGNLRYYVVTILLAVGALAILVPMFVYLIS